MQIQMPKPSGHHLDAFVPRKTRHISDGTHVRIKIVPVQATGVRISQCLDRGKRVFLADQDVGVADRALRRSVIQMGDGCEAFEEDYLDARTLQVFVQFHPAVSDAGADDESPSAAAGQIGFRRHVELQSSFADTSVEGRQNVPRFRHLENLSPCLLLGDCGRGFTKFPSIPDEQGDQFPGLIHLSNPDLSNK
jgi:hypothetical protein